MKVNVYYQENPASDTAGEQLGIIRKPTTIHDVIKQTFRNGKLDRMTICKVDGKAIPESQWDYKLKRRNKTVQFEAILGNSIGSFLTSVISIPLASFQSAFSFVGDLFTIDIPEIKQPDSTYTFAGKSSKNRLGYPIEVWYGRNKMFPSTGSQDYTQFIDDKEWLYSARCIGHGEFDLSGELDGVYVDDTLSDNYTDFEYEIVPPGEKLTLFPDNVITSEDVDNIRMYVEGEEDWEGYSGPFPANEAGTKITQIQIDFVYPSGVIDSDGSSYPNTWWYEFREIDDNGDPVGSGDWTRRDLKIRAKTTNAIRKTYLEDVPEGRYEVRCNNTGDNGSVPGAGEVSQLYWYALRGFLPSTIDYSLELGVPVTMLAFKARATDNLGASESAQVNVRGTRKLPIYNGSEWTDDSLVATRSIAWAFADAVRNQVYGGKLDDTDINASKLIEDDAFFDSKGWYYDDVYESRTGLFDVLKRICKVGRAIPQIIGNEYSIVIDKEETSPTFLYTSDNSQSISHKLVRPTRQKYDGIEIEYEDNDTWLPETVPCLIDDDAGDNIRSLKIYGIKDRDNAYQYGLYLRAKEKFQRLGSTASVNKDGRSRVLLDYGGIAHEQVSDAYTGLVRSIDETSTLIELSDPVYFTAGETHVIRLKTVDGGTIGPYECIETNSPFTVETTTPVTESLLALDPNQDPPVYTFGVFESEIRPVKITSITPSSGESVELAFALYDERVYQYDSEIAPPIGDDPVPPITPDLPVIEGIIAVTVSEVNPNFIILNWNIAPGATKYIIESSVDFITWTEVATTTVSNYTKVADVDATYYRVAGVNVGQGPWAYNYIQLTDDEGNILVDDEGNILVTLETEL